MFKRTNKNSVELTEPTSYPNNSFVKTERGYFYIVNESKRFRIISKRVLDSWSPHRVIETSEAAVANYRVAAKMKFRNGSLIHSMSDGKMYLVSDGLRRHITSPEALTRIGAKRSDAVLVSLDEIKLHEEGEPLK